MTITFGLDETKINRPNLRPDLIKRRRLLDRLHQCVDRQLVVVQAGAGMGKSTLLGQFSAELDFPVCWYQVSPVDRDLATLAQGLVSSLSASFPGFGQQTSSYLRAGVRDESDAEALAKAFLSDVSNHVSDYTLVVLDDVHEVLDEPTAAVFLEVLTSHLPDSLHILVATRQRLPFTGLARLVANRQAALFTADDLRFTQEEVNDFFVATHGITLDSAQSDLAWHRSRGWAAILAISPPGQLVDPEAPHFDLHDDLLIDYLANEVIDREAPNVRDFLVRTSVLDELSPAICDHILGGVGARTVLQELSQSNPLVIKTGEDSYVLHSLLREHLKQELNANFGGKTGLHLKAATWFQETGRWMDSFDHFLLAGREDDAAVVADKAVNGLVEQGLWVTICEKLKRLPGATLAEHPHLLLGLARAHGELGEPDKHLKLSDDALKAFGESGDGLGCSRSLLSKVMALRLKGMARPALDLALEALSQLEQSQAPSADVAAANYQVGMCYLGIGILKEARAHLNEATKYFESVGDTAQSSSGHHYLGVACKDAGEIQTAIIELDAAARGWQQLGNQSRLASCLNTYGGLYYETGIYDLALEFLNRSNGICEDFDLTRVRSYVLTSIARVLSSSANVEQAISSFEQGLEIAANLNDAHLLSCAKGEMARAKGLMGETAQAARLIDEALLLTRHLGESMQEGSQLAIRGEIFLASGDLSEAEADLIAASEILDRNSGMWEQAGAVLLLGVVHLRQGRTTLAKENIEDAARLAQALGHHGFVRRLGPIAEEALVFACKDSALAQTFESALFDLRTGKHVSEISQEAIKPDPTKVSKPTIVAFGFGRTEVYTDGKIVSASQWRSSKAKEMFFYLATNQGPVTKDRLIEDLWPDRSPGSVESSLRSTLFRLRHALYFDVVQSAAKFLCLDANANLTYDVNRFRSLIHQAGNLSRTNPVKENMLSEAISIYEGPFVEEFYSDWTIRARETLETAAVEAGLSAAEVQTEIGHLEDAVRTLSRVVELDHLNEVALCQLMNSLILIQRPASAVRAYRDFEQLISREMGLRPGGKLRSLFESLMEECQDP